MTGLLRPKSSEMGNFFCMIIVVYLGRGIFHPVLHSSYTFHLKAVFWERSSKLPNQGKNLYKKRWREPLPWHGVSRLSALFLLRRLASNCAYTHTLLRRSQHTIPSFFFCFFQSNSKVRLARGIRTPASTLIAFD